VFFTKVWSKTAYKRQTTAPGRMESETPKAEKSGLFHAFGPRPQFLPDVLTVPALGCLNRHAAGLVQA
jgi:hypothetical protein